MSWPEFDSEIYIGDSEASGPVGTSVADMGQVSAWILNVDDTDPANLKIVAAAYGMGQPTISDGRWRLPLNKFGDKDLDPDVPALALAVALSTTGELEGWFATNRQLTLREGRRSTGAGPSQEAAAATA